MKQIINNQLNSEPLLFFYREMNLINPYFSLFSNQNEETSILLDFVLYRLSTYMYAILKSFLKRKQNKNRRKAKN